MTTIAVFFFFDGGHGLSLYVYCVHFEFNIKEAKSLDDFMCLCAYYNTIANLIAQTAKETEQ